MLPNVYYCCLIFQCKMPRLSFLPSLLTYLLTPWSRVLLEKLTGFQLVTKFPTFYGTRRFITVFTSTRHLSPSRASSIQYIPPYPTSWRPILILFSQLCLGLPSGFFPSGFHPEILYTLYSTHTRYMLRPSHYSTDFYLENYVLYFLFSGQLKTLGLTSLILNTTDIFLRLFSF
jgi:hypothetical protein